MFGMKYYYVNGSETVAYNKKTIKLKDEVEMTGSKSTQTRFVRDKHLLYIPSLAFLDY